MPGVGRRQSNVRHSSGIALTKLLDMQKGYEMQGRMENARVIGEIIREVQERIMVPRADLKPEQLGLIDSYESEAAQT